MPLVGAKEATSYKNRPSHVTRYDSTMARYTLLLRPPVDPRFLLQRKGLLLKETRLA